jgi:hypothetical protein
VFLTKVKAFLKTQKIKPGLEAEAIEKDVLV